MLLSSFGPRGGSLAVVAFVLFAFGVFYMMDMTPYHRESGASPAPPAPPQTPRYRPTPSPNAPVTENFPAAAKATSAADLPQIPSFNKPKIDASEKPAPLLIGFTRNWPVLQQAVVSYLAAGWPADQIYVIENTGTMHANRLGQLTLQNPFYIDYKRLTSVFGVNVVTTPALLTFAQLQNFMMFYALEKEWATYFWSHMDVAVVPDERFTVADKEDTSMEHFTGLFRRAMMKRDELVAWEAAGDPSLGPEEHRNTNGKWAIEFFAYDRLTLVNLNTWIEVGGWDPLIPYYMGDCDFYGRLRMGRYRMGSSDIGMIADVGSTLDDLGVYFRRKDWPSNAAPEDEASGTESLNKEADFGLEDERGGHGYDELHDKVSKLQDRKLGGGDYERNFWQSQQQGGQGEPFYYDSEGFERGLLMTMDHGRRVYDEKWAHRDCDINGANLQPQDAWRLAR